MTLPRHNRPTTDVGDAGTVVGLFPEAPRGRRLSTRTTERRGRGLRGPILPPQVPRYRTRGARFDHAAMEAFARIDQHFHDRLVHIDLAVDMVPRLRLREGATEWPEEVTADRRVPLARLLTTGVTRDGVPVRPRIVLFRRPIEERAATEEALEELIYQVLVRQIATFLHVDPSVIDPAVDGHDFGPGDLGFGDERR